ncbi:hypothetical protein H9Y04_39715 [Streptomyces sp. TRM66268-LWL]|uniref:Uncharacterized protein n=1 Tax=Streptomyces polyasparticus TaxID=2767826 RepID=A0ABR7ST54_9ACTN|nr:hypothetical protein [Streptomyces polyasparticus]MBC9718672.1 hypothetical protein [Streptomyces polyasparticus]
MSSGIPDDHKHARRRRLQASARVRARRVELALDRARTRAAQAISPDPESVAAHRQAAATAERALAELDAEGRVFTRRDTGARVVLRDKLATADAAPVHGAGRGEELGDDRYEVECLTHQSDPLFFGELTAATRAARHSDTWCEACRQLASTPHTVRARARKVLAPAKPEIRYTPPEPRLRFDPPAT